MRVLSILALALVTTGCAVADKELPVITSTKSSLELRAMQSRLYSNVNRSKAVRTVISTLQDLGYNIDKVDAGSGTVTATKLAQLQLSASVTPRGDLMAVRANAQVKLGPQSNQVDAAEFYQTLFFAPLSAAMFLSATTDTGPVASDAPKSIPARPKPPQS